MALLAIYDATSNGLKPVVTRLTEPMALKLATMDYGQATNINFGWVQFVPTRCIETAKK
jgi:hypothetical protein